MLQENPFPKMLNFKFWKTFKPNKNANILILILLKFILENFKNSKQIKCFPKQQTHGKVRSGLNFSISCCLRPAFSSGTATLRSLTNIGGCGLYSTEARLPSVLA